MRAGIITATIANVNRDAKRHPVGYKPEDFMPFLSEQTQVSHTDSYRPITDPAEFNRMASAVRAAWGKPPAKLRVA